MLVFGLEHDPTTRTNTKEGNMALYGRSKETRGLDQLYDSDRPELLALYGRRRVGKTFLIKQVF